MNNNLSPHKLIGISWDKNWEKIRFKRGVQLINEKAENIFNYVGLENVESWTGKLTNNITKSIEEDAATADRFYAGNVLFGKLRPYLAKTFVAQEDGCCTPELLVFRPLHYDSNYLKYLLLTTDFVYLVNSSTYGVKMPRANWEFIGNISIPKPPLSVQQAIASFLDRKTAAIDTLIAKKQRLIQLLEQKRTAFINQAVTKGLNPKVPMKDSGIPWIGYIPGHWKIMRLKFLTARVTSGSRGWAQYYSEQGAIFIRINNLSRKSIELNLKDIQYVQPPLDAEGERSRVQLGDLLISVTAYIGTVGVVTQDLGEAYVNQHVALTRPRQDLVNPQWLGLYLFASAGQHQFNALLDGSTKDGLGLEDIKNLFALVPPRKEQLEIVDLLSLQISRTAKLINTVSEQIKKLQEYRQSLITAAVTGKIDIREEVAA
ncbi:restriction modification system DNA specificity domain-containing protein [Nostoc cf. commune SO-36]|uniref:Restriction modification system DNA specificity domain-containing protein n=1 Tax=Nostoc cf. commune SO-36 TaxID=449208 RepID=A0ABN6Q7H2_NOSCO|nr:restriction endonuclease subunit S [Nostoc commune]BDI19096.1 restriction modification system DNA specificity domain-containing protein [Nostoc cf. commune SO-36]